MDNIEEREFKSFFKDLSEGNESRRCNYTTRLDTYGTGCAHDCRYCLSMDTPVLMYDGTIRRIEDVRVGDELYGVVKEGTYYRFRKSIVLNTWEVRKPSYKITLSDSREVICSGDHRWLTERGWKYTTGKMTGPERRPYLTTSNNILGIGCNAVCYTPTETEMYYCGYLSGIIRGDGSLTRYEYGDRGYRHTDVQYHFRLAMKETEAVEKTARILGKYGIEVQWFDFEMVDRKTQKTVKHRAIRTSKKESYETIRNLIEYRDNNEYRRGFLAGIYDAEGSTNPRIKRVYNTDRELFNFLCTSLERFGFQYRVDKKREDSGKTLYNAFIIGGITEFLRFRQITDATPGKFSIEGVALKSPNTPQVVSIEPYSEEERLIDITTSTENFIANGFVSHNCYAKSLLAFRGMWRPNDPAVADINEIRKTIRRELHPHEIVRLGGMTDCLQPAERKHHITLATIGELNKAGVGYLIVTKNKLVAEDEYIKEMDRSLAHIQVSVTTTDAGISKRYEPGASLPEERIAAVERLQAEGFDVSVRLSPYIPQFVDIDRINAIKCDKVLVEFLRVNHWIEKWMRDVDLRPYTLNKSGYKHLPLAVKKKLIARITGFKQVSVCEDVYGHWLYWKQNLNANPDDCCNLRVAYKENLILKRK